ncbi:DsrH protein [Pseudomonas cichorii]|uniref:DsrH protein n=1 Tax=Pseudomonas cichorii TaxID=36746 RepID=A0A3M4LX11_PSECI|nr:sulfurtransferase complex subunit TusB [Pseudomonas cichorii]RMQ45940.1 DsrH protein [Pseudomonas cichorii]
MATLHVLSHSPFADTRLDSCLSLLRPDDGLLLCGDATYALMPSCAPLLALEKHMPALRLFALDEDISARNLQLPDGVTGVDYPGFVELSIRFDKVNTWL